MIQRLKRLVAFVVIYPYALYRTWKDIEKFRRFQAAREVCVNCVDDSLCEQHQFERDVLIQYGLIRPMYWELWPRDQPIVTHIPLQYRLAVSGYGGEA